MVLVEKVLISSYYFRWNLRITHCISYRAEIINIQPLGNKAKAYQVKQVRNLILKYKLAR